MDIATFAGLIAAFGLTAYGIAAGGSLSTFFDLPSLAIVAGGAFGMSLIAHPFASVVGTVRVIGKTFTDQLPDKQRVIREIVECARLARQEGLLALEKYDSELKIEFLDKGLRLVADGLEPKEIEKTLWLEIDNTAERHARSTEVLINLGNYAPAMGMVGTLIGLVLMLENMSEPSTIGPAMAIALLTTFYGALLANTLFLPMAAKLKGRSRDEMMIYELIANGLQSLVAGDHPRMIEQKLMGYLPPKERFGEYG